MERKDVDKKIRVVEERVEEIEGNYHRLIQELEQILQDKTNELIMKLSCYFKSDEMKSSVTTWTSDDAPKKQESWAATEPLISQAIARRFAEEIQHWEEELHYFSEAKDFLQKEFSQKLNFLQGEIGIVEKSIIFDHALRMVDSFNSTSLTTGERVFNFNL